MLLPVTLIEISLYPPRRMLQRDITTRKVTDPMIPSPRVEVSTCPIPPSIQLNRALAIFYPRAKQTLFAPNSPYGLDSPSDIQ